MTRRLTRPISSSLREFQHGAFAIKTIRARPMKTPALQASLIAVTVINPTCVIHKGNKSPTMQMGKCFAVAIEVPHFFVTF